MREHRDVVERQNQGKSTKATKSIEARAYRKVCICISKTCIVFRSKCGALGSINGNHDAEDSTWLILTSERTEVRHESWQTGLIQDQTSLDQLSTRSLPAVLIH